MFRPTSLATAVLTAALAVPAFATTVVLPTQPGAAGYGQWSLFDVSDLDAQSQGLEWIDANNSLSPDFGSPLVFSFTIDAGLTGRLLVVDAGFAGDTFRVRNHGSVIGDTAAVPVTSYDTAPNAGLDIDAAWADSANFSSGTFQLGAGTYQISGQLLQSVLLDGAPLNATVGAVSLTVSAVPEPSAMAMLLAGMGLIATMVRRRSGGSRS